MAILVPDLLYRGGVFHTGLGVDFDERTGRIRRIAHQLELNGAERLTGRALLPGFVNAHSHAFQRLIRGRTQWRPADASISDFWSWREEMYAAAGRLEPQDVYDVSRWCFIEMLRAGITTVGEFHYLHNAPDGTPYDDRAELARRVVEAARSVGMRIRLLNTCYATGSIGQPLARGQLRFATPDVDAFVAITDELAAAYASDDLVSVGIAPHSVRAVPREWLPRLRDWSVANDAPLHMHVSEQPGEVDACVAAYGRRPVELLDEDGLLSERFTAVHATHITDAEVGVLAHAGAAVCACPTTERDLGDGILRAADLLRAGVAIALGTDSQTMLDMFAEMRLAEYGERLRRLHRVLLTRPADDVLEVAPVLLGMATAAGARALRVNGGVLEEGALADMVAIDLEHPALAGWTARTLPAALVFSAGPDTVSDVWVSGRRVVREGSHAGQEEAMRAFNAVARG